MRPWRKPCRECSDELFDILATHPDERLRENLAGIGRLTAEQRVRMIGDPSVRVLFALVEGPEACRGEPMPARAYRKLAENPRVNRMLQLMSPNEVHSAAVAALPEIFTDVDAPVPTAEPPSAERARTIAASGSVSEKGSLALELALPADVIATLSTDPDPWVRTRASMRPELSEQQRAAIDYRVTENDRLPRLGWVIDADGEQLQRCVCSAHPALRRSAAINPRLTTAQIATLAADEDFPVRLLLCENRTAVPAELVVRTYLEARVITRGQLLWHPALEGADLTRYADSPHWGARALVVRDPHAPAALIERLSHDEHPGVRSWMARDTRLSRQRLLELLDDPSTAEAAAANPNLPAEVMEAILAAAADDPPGDRVLVLGRSAARSRPPSRRSRPAYPSNAGRNSSRHGRR